MERQLIVPKFGGTSVATSENTAKVAEIISSDKARQFVVVSGPGKRFGADVKITDLLYRSHDAAARGTPISEPFDQVAARFEGIGRDLGCYEHSDEWIKQVRDGIIRGESRDWTASRGEWLMAKILAKYIGFEFTDAFDMIRLNSDGSTHPKTYDLIKKLLKDSQSYHVIPGFYGQHIDTGRVITYPRNGSDITGAVVAAQVIASVYENWTDRDGLLAADPQIVERARPVRAITYWELRELGNNGVDILQRDAVQPAFHAGIPINIRNTFNLQDAGTFVVKERVSPLEENVIAIASRSGYLSIKIRRFGINEHPGYISAITEALAQEKISIEHIPTGADTLTLVIDTKQLKDNGKEIAIDAVSKSAKPDEMETSEDLGFVCLVGQQAPQKLNSLLITASEALLKFGINIESVNAPQRGDSVRFGINSLKTSQAVKILYDCFIEPGQ